MANETIMEMPLVSVFLITYNSAETVVEALESVKAQTYKNIELIVSDDASKDDTVRIVREWVDKNKDRFTDVKVITAQKNGGIAPNCNRAVKASSGKWLKVLAGDDQLKPEAIEEYLNFMNKHPEADIAFAKLEMFGVNPQECAILKSQYEENLYPKIRLSQPQQYMEDLWSLFVPGPGLFFSRKLFDEIGGYDERYPMCEEHPFTSYTLHNKHHIKFIDKELYRYRISEHSYCRQEKTLSVHEKDKQRFFIDWKLPLLEKYGQGPQARHKASKSYFSFPKNERTLGKTLKFRFTYFFDSILLKLKK
ncbi:MAG: glycosyltransferase [Muribaculaceae bacterium]|nr:glycosyltransferase [Muribaculaceae bacterium]